jgi:sugar/nucleoside kinase (ribokinase family)
MFHFGYLLTMDAMDASDPEFGTVAARFLCDLQTRGIRTSIDLVSEDSHRFEKIVPPSLPYVNYCIINDFEAEKLSGVNLRREGRLIEGNLRRSAELILDLGVRDLVVIHFPEGAYLLTHDGRAAIQPSLDLPNDVVVCAVGAGDSFCAGVLYGIHQEWSLTDTLQFAVCAGARNLLDLSTTGAIIRWREILKMKNTYRFRRGIT